jgi:hypothetical protein
MSNVAGGPGAEGDVEPGEGHEAEEGAGYFVEELFEDAPEAAKTGLGWGFGGANGSGHGNILAHNQPGDATDEAHAGSKSKV